MLPSTAMELVEKLPGAAKVACQRAQEGTVRHRRRAWKGEVANEGRGTSRRGANEASPPVPGPSNVAWMKQ